MGLSDGGGLQTNKKRNSETKFNYSALVVRAGKRTYFFNVRVTSNNDCYLTITESKKRINDDRTSICQKHKIFLYKEGFSKFAGSLVESIQKVIELNDSESQEKSDILESNFSDIEFEDLGNKE
tara:strand:- start:472 stop:843 length:372 start_codon:yes stop_codon:yes gene_type:complete